MSSTIFIESIKPTAKSLVIKSGGREYFAKKDSGLDGKVGSTIEAETKQSNFNGKDYVWIEKWKAASNATPAPAVTATGINLSFLPFVSNVVAHAIQCGRIENPADIQAWADAAYTAAANLSDAWQK